MDWSGAFPDDLTGSQFHAILLLSDSALPLGSFAFSSGLESFLAHRARSSWSLQTFIQFLDLSLDSVASMTLPYVCEAYMRPKLLSSLDNDFDSSTSCAVARRASMKQGRALLTLWERSFKAHSTSFADENTSAAADASQSLSAFAGHLKSSPPETDIKFGEFPPVGHLAPLFGVVCAALSVPLSQAIYLYLLNHTKALLSASIRASVLGPYQSQGIMASHRLKNMIWSLVNDTLRDMQKQSQVKGSPKLGKIEQAGQTVPALDLWTGRHEIIYSRIFNS